jgi:hypothetical protein
VCGVAVFTVDSFAGVAIVGCLYGLGAIFLD